MASHRIPTNPVGLYWVYWAPFKRLIDYPTTYNIIFLFHAYPPENERVYGLNASGQTVLLNPGGETGRVDYREPSGTPGANLIADIATCRARGQKIILSVGGAGGQIYLTDHDTTHPLNVPDAQTRADNFVQSIKDINAGLGGSGTTNAIDGIDWNNFEGVQQGSQGTWMTYVGQQLRAYYGDDFIFTSPPAASSFLNQNTADRALLAELYQGGVLDWACPQFYDDASLTTESNITNQLNFYNTSIPINGVNVQIPRDYLGIGFAVGAVGNLDRWTASEARTAYLNAVANELSPKGAFNWANYEDTSDSFATTVAPVITNNTDPAPALFSLVASANFTNGDVTTAQLTPPSGKTAGSDFQAGQMKETTNATTLNLASDKYTEIEWNIQATADAVNAQQYEFRVTVAGVALTSETVTPKWTIGTAPTVTNTMTGISSITGITSITL